MYSARFWRQKTVTRVYFRTVLSTLAAKSQLSVSLWRHWRIGAKKRACTFEPIHNSSAESQCKQVHASSAPNARKKRKKGMCVGWLTEGLRVGALAGVTVIWRQKCVCVSWTGCYANVMRRALSAPNSCLCNLISATQVISDNYVIKLARLTV